MSAQEEDQTSAEGTETQQTAKGIRGLSASEFEPIESENGNIVILYTNDVHCAVETGISFDITVSSQKFERFPDFFDRDFFKFTVCDHVIKADRFFLF